MYFTFCYASTYSITFTVTVDFFNLLGYSIIFFLYSKQSEQEVSPPLPAHQTWRFNVVNLISDEVIES